MKCFEYMGKEIFKKYNVPVPNGRVARSVEEAIAILPETGNDAVIKAQILSGGRGKAGGVKFAKTPAEMKEAAGSILGTKLKDLTVNRVLVEQKMDIKREIYLSIMMDTESKDVKLALSAEGGVEIESNADSIVFFSIGSEFIIKEYMVRNMLYKAGLPTEYTAQMFDIIQKIIAIFKDYNATLVEINPLIVNGEGKIIACDAKMNIDNNIIPYNEEVQAMLRSDPVSYESECFKLENDFDYLDLDPNGQIGLLSTGAGLTMAIVDMLQARNVSPSNFIDIRTGGFRGKTERLETAFKRMISNPNLKVILVNVFGGITDLNEFATLLVKARDLVHVQVPVIIRLEGNNYDKANATLKAVGLEADTSLDVAVDKAIALLGVKA